MTAFFSVFARNFFEEVTFSELSFLAEHNLFSFLVTPSFASL